MVEGKQLVAIRVTRPYSTEEEFLEHEIETLTRTSVMLIGAQSRPQGVILRFEVALLNGAPLMRGEGRVIGFRANALGDLPGLTLRFTRLDKKTKALVDKATLIRDARSRAAFEASMGEGDLGPNSIAPLSMGPNSMPAPTSSSGPVVVSSPISSTLTDGIPPSMPASSDAPSAPPELVASPPPSPRPPTASAPPPHASARPPAASAPPPHASARPSSPDAPPARPSSDRDSLLLRLRERARAMTPSTVEGILDDARRSRPPS